MITTEQLELFRTKRAAGASLKALAREAGLTWQRIDKAIRNGLPQCEAIPVPVDSNPVGLLVDAYRPRDLDSILGQPQVVKFLKSMAKRPAPAALLFSGATGTGKTTAAFALAAALGCDLDQREFGGLHVIASGELEKDIQAARDEVPRMPIPEYAFDCHTKKGRVAGKTREQFFKDEQKALQPREPGLFDHLIPE